MFVTIFVTNKKTATNSGVNFMAGMTQKRALKALFSLWSLDHKLVV